MLQVETLGEQRSSANRIVSTALKLVNYGALFGKLEITMRHVLLYAGKAAKRRFSAVVHAAKHTTGHGHRAWRIIIKGL
jgi:hypothetical protein